MAYTVKRKPQKPERPARTGPSLLDKMHVTEKAPQAAETVRESAVEVREKLKEDLGRISRLARVRRSVSLKPMVACLECNRSGKATCLTCGGAGSQKLVLNDEMQRCEACQGSGEVTCVECMGRGLVPNVHRKKVMWMLVVGGLAWAYVLFRLWGGDVLPEQRAKYMAGGGGGGGTGRPAPAATLGSPVSPRGAQSGHFGQPSGAPGAPGASAAAGRLGAPAAGSGAPAAPRSPTGAPGGR